VTDQNSDTMQVTRFTLANGLEVLVYPYPVIPWVATQLWYRVGSKHEQDGQRGAAHLLEHMLFKGTKRMSELDVTAITDALSGYSNAFTNQDYTAYLFDFPRANWTVGLDLLADCMSHATIKPDLLNGELAAVIQELRLYNDDYEATLEETLTGDIFSGHPYHYPVIGYRHDLWHMTDDALMHFYKQWYKPNNAVLVVVGDVTVEEVKTQTERFFGHIPAGKLPVIDKSFWQSDMMSHSVALSYDIHQLSDVTSFIIPGFNQGKHELVSTLGTLLADGISSRLYKTLVRADGTALSVESCSGDLDEYDLFFIKVQHEHESNRRVIHNAIRQELDDLATNGPTEHELERAYALACMERQELFQDMQELATVIGHGFASTGDANYGLRKPSNNYAKLAHDIQDYVRRWCRRSQAHFGQLKAISSDESKLWQMNQNKKDASDESFIAARVRQTPLEPLLYAHTIATCDLDEVPFPPYKKYELAHKSNLITCVTKTTKTVVALVTFANSYYNEPEDKAGIAELTARLVIDAVIGFTPDEFADLIERRGMSLEAGPGFIALTMLTVDGDYGLTLLGDIIAQPKFDEHSFNRMRGEMIAELDDLFDDTYASVDQYARQRIYGTHPYGRLSLGNKKSLESLTLADVRAWHAYAYQVYASKIVVVGDFDQDRVAAHINKLWRTLPADCNTPPILPTITSMATMTPSAYTLPRDQTALCYAGLSVSRTDAWYDPLLLLDQIVCGGEMGSMYSLLFQVRERTGLFYSITGSPLVHAGLYAGMVRIKTLVCPDRVEKADYEIKKALRDIPEYITPETLAKARSSIISARMQTLLSNKQLATLLISLERCGLSLEYELQLQQRLANISVDTVCAAADQFLNPERLVRITVGR